MHVWVLHSTSLESELQKAWGLSLLLFFFLLVKPLLCFFFLLSQHAGFLCMYVHLQVLNLRKSLKISHFLLISLKIRKCYSFKMQVVKRFSRSLWTVENTVFVVLFNWRAILGFKSMWMEKIFRRSHTRTYSFFQAYRTLVIVPIHLLLVSYQFLCFILITTWLFGLP